MGRTTDGRPVLGGVMRLTDSQGIPLQAVVQHCAARGLAVDWAGYLDDALAAGWNASTAMAKAEEALSDVLGGEAAAETALRMRLHIAALRKERC